MTLGTLLLYVGIVAVILTAIVHYAFNARKSWLVSFLQNFCGALFIFSGWVKAVDPLGTAYKMEQYFDQFEFVFSETWFSFLAPLFPILSDYAVGFSVFVIVFEIVLGIMLVIGQKPKFTAWAFLLLVVFFTFLTGFTYLTGYVPEGANFFEFGKWSVYKESNMKVTDCGCFGDFIKLEPKVSFLKDVVLLFPAVYFILRMQNMHQLFSRTIRNLIVIIAIIGLTYYCLSNYLWDLPHKDFRPFQIGKNIAEQKRLEDEALSNVQILAYEVKNKESGEQKTIPYSEYLKTFQQYPSEEWELNQLYSEPSMVQTKIAEFDVMDEDGGSMNNLILNSEGPLLFIVAHKLYGDGTPSTRIVRDTIFNIDTIYRSNGEISLDRSIAQVNEVTESYIDYQWKQYYKDRYDNIILPFINNAMSQDIPVIAAIGGADYDQIMDFRDDMQMDIQYGLADDILLKTIVRSNPGIVLMNKGILVNKWHYKRLPSFEQVKAFHLE